MDSDDRFKHLATDPRFKTLRKKQRLVHVDERFKSMFTDEKFTLKYKQDKRGNAQRKTSGDDLRLYYHLEEGGQDDDDDEDDHDDEGDNEDDNESIASEDVSSSSDESDSEGADDPPDKIQYDWQPLDHDAERTDIVTRRIAIQNLDWTHLQARDIYTLVNSIRPPLCVTIYVSEFGKERLAKEETEGPLELAEMPELDEDEQEYKQLEEKMQALQNKEKKYKANEYEDADDIIDSKNEEIRERLRRYQLSQMKYYYAIAEFDSPESAQAVYKELDGIEYEGSSLELDLRYVPDDMEFDPADIKAVCDKVPDLATYKAPQFINSALQQTTVKVTWDETDVKRQEMLNKAYTKQELEQDDLEAYLASETDSDDDEADESKYRLLLQSLDEEAASKKKYVVEFDEDDNDDHDDDDDEDNDEDNDKDKEKMEKKKKKKDKKEKKTQKPKRKRDPELDLLVLDPCADKQENFKFDPDDARFEAVYESGLYNIDPSHPNFKRTDAFDRIAERKRDKRLKKDK